MWILTNVHTGDCFHLISEKLKYSVGRVGTDLVLRGDASVSRTHAFLQFLSETAVETKQLQLVDCGSKYGSYHNEGIEKKTPLSKGEHITLSDGDRIQFGLLKNMWRVSINPLKSLTSVLPRDLTQKFEEYMKALDGKVFQQWEEGCTHLTMAEITVTVKLLHALLEQIPIVTCEYWRDLLKAVRQGTALPSATLFAPRLCESLTQKHDEVDLGSRPERKQLFAGMTFVFMSRKHYEQYAPIVKKASGICKDLNSGVQKTFMIKPNVVVVQYVPSTQSQSLQTISSIEGYLESHSRRIIPEYEIGLAIVHCSTVKYCNAGYKLLGESMPSTLSMETESPWTDTVLNENTPMSVNKLNLADSDIIVPETEEGCTSSSISAIKTTRLSGDVNANAAATSSLNSNTATGDYLAAETPVDSEEFDDMSNICVTESVDKGSQIKRKRGSENMRKVNSNGDDNNEELFQFSKRQHFDTDSSINKQTEILNEMALPAVNTAKPKFSPLPIVTNSKRKTFNTGGFIEKSQVQPATSAHVEKETGNTSSDKPTRKRPRIAVLSDGDDDDDLFCFGDSNVASSTATGTKKTRLSYHHHPETNTAADSDEELFGFTSAKASVSKDVVDNVASNAIDVEYEEDDLMPTQPLIRNGLAVRNRRDPIMPKPKLLPQKISTDGWLSCSLHNMEIKSEQIIENKKISELDDEATISTLSHQQWVDSLKGSFAVRSLNSTTVVQRRKDTLHNLSESNNSISVNALNNSVKNYKAFVKKCNQHPQQIIIKTVAVPVVQLRLR